MGVAIAIHMAGTQEAVPTQSDPRWLPLYAESKLANSDEDIATNIASALARPGLRRYMEIAGTQRGAVSIVGSGPSLKGNWKRLIRFKGDIIACNSACQFLLEKGIVPKYMMCFDADPLALEFVVPHPEITYLIGSRCPPSVFDALEGCNVVCWHAAGDKYIEDLLQKSDRFDDPMIPGGSAAVTRAMLIGQSLGYTALHLWGVDSSFGAGRTHLQQSTTIERRTYINMGGRVFETAPWMTMQLQDFEKLAPPLRDTYKLKIVVHGDGLIPQAAVAMGFDVDWSLAWRHEVRRLKYEIKQFWKTL
jgi:hypothetical protein